MRQNSPALWRPCFLTNQMAWRILIVCHLRNISTKLFENRYDSFGGEDLLSFHYSKIRQNSPVPGDHVFVRSINMAWRNLIEDHQRNISRFVTMETRILHGSKQNEGILVKWLRGCFLWSFLQIDPLVTEEKMMTDTRRTTDKRRSQ